MFLLTFNLTSLPRGSYINGVGGGWDWFWQFEGNLYCNILLSLFTINILIFSTIIVTFMWWADIKLQYCTFYLDFLPPSASPRQKKSSMEDLLGHILGHPVCLDHQALTNWVPDSSRWALKRICFMTSIIHNLFRPYHLSLSEEELIW